MESLDEQLKRLFGFEAFRTGQREVIEHVLAGRHTLAVLPTGSGKSLCYQLSSQMLSGITVVVSPLIALMQDQTDQLAKRGFKDVTFFSSTLGAAETSARYRQIESGRCKLIYIAPERCDSPRFQQFVRNADISLLVIDEAHCISQWGHDFRPHYRTISLRLPELKKATILAMTATATPEVRKDIMASLGVSGMQQVLGNFDRPNLRLQVISADAGEKDMELLALLEKDPGPTIVYCSTRKQTGDVNEMLRDRGFSVCLYHAGLSAEQRTKSQNAFLSGQTQIVVATVAFGMGIDKADVRKVIHYNLPGSPERYYQEAGRAGRDGQPSFCTLLYSSNDVRTQRFFVDQAHPDPDQVLRIYQMVRQAHPEALAPVDLTQKRTIPELGVNAALQILYMQGWLGITPEGKYVAAKPEEARPAVDFRDSEQRYRRDNARLERMIAYAGNRVCRRVHLLQYFGQPFQPPCGNCDVCAPAARTGPVAQAQEGTADSDRVARIILQAAMTFAGRFGRGLIKDVLMGSERKKVFELRLQSSPLYGQLQHNKGTQIAQWMEELVDRELLEVTVEEYPRLLITKTGRQALVSTELIALSGFRAARVPVRAAETKRAPQNPALRIQLEVYRQGGPEPGRETLLTALQKEDGSELIHVLTAVAALGIKDAAQHLPRLLQSANANIVATACEAAGKLGAVEMLPRIVPLLSHSSAAVRRGAVRAAGLFRAADAIPELERIIREDDSDFVILAARAAIELIKNNN